MTRLTHTTRGIGFDFEGNQISKGHDAAEIAKNETVTSSYNDRDQLIGEESSIDANDRTSGYDDDGSLLWKKHGTATVESYTWDLRNRITSATVGPTIAQS